MKGCKTFTGCFLHSQAWKLQLKKMYPHKENILVLSFLPSPSPIFCPTVFLLDLSRECRGAGEVISNIGKLYYAFLVKDRYFQKNIRVTLNVCAQSLSYAWLFASPGIAVQPGSYVHGILQARILVPVWSLSHVDSLWPHGLQHARLPCPSLSQNFLKLTSIESLILSNHLILCCSLLFLPSTFPSISVFSKKSALCIRRPKYWSFSFNISPSNEYSGLISFRNDWFDLLAVQGTLKSPPAPQLNSINSSVLSLLYGPTLRSAHDYMDLSLV